VTTRRRTETLVRPFSDVMWPGPTTLKTMDSLQLLWSTGVSHLRRVKRKKSSDDAATGGDPSAFVLPDDVVWTDNVENDGQWRTAVGNWRQSPETSKAEKIE